MKTRLIAMILATMAGCGSSKPPTSASNHSRPEIGAWGFDTAGMDTQVAPGASFYNYANGKWLAIDADPGRQGRTTACSPCSRIAPTSGPGRSSSRASGAPGSDGQRIADYFKTFMDEAAIEAKGIAPIQPELDGSPGSRTPPAWSWSSRRAPGGSAAAARSARPRSAPWSARTRASPTATSRTSRRAASASPIATCTTPKKKQFAKVRDGYKKYIATMLHADRCQGRRPARRGGLRRSRRSSRRPTGRGSRTATRRRPTTR